MRFHLAEDGVVLPVSVEGFLLGRRAGYYILADAKILSSEPMENGDVREVISPVDGEFEVPARRVIGREIRR